MAIIAATVIGGGTVTVLGNRSSAPASLPGTIQKEGCIIKGNISSKGEKIYHTPGQRYYDRTEVSTAKGERWFCSEKEAIGAGWRKSKV